MTEPTDPHQSWSWQAITSIIAVVGFLIQQLWSLITGHSKRLAELERSRATVDQLAEAEDRIDRKFQDMRKEQTDRDIALGQKIDDGFASVHQRIDKLFDSRA